MNLPRVAAVALNQTPLDWTGNLARITEGIEKARAQGAGLILLPELALTGYGCEDYFFMPWLARQAESLFYEKIVPLSRGMLVAVGLPVFHEEKLYNTLGLALDGKPAGFYCKQRLPHTGVFYEPRWFSAGKPGWKTEKNTPSGPVPLGDFTVAWAGIQVGFEICEDAWHPGERPAMCGAAHEAGLILNASASNYGRGKQAERHTLITGLAGHHTGFYLYTNLVGNESGRLIFDGEIIFGKAGRVLKSSSILSMEEVRVLTFDPGAEPPPCLPAREDDEEEFTYAVSLGLLDYLRKSRSRGFALSLSGGADSAACAVLVSEMIRRAHTELGRKGMEDRLGFALSGNNLKELVSQLLVCVYQSTRNSGSVTRNAARNLAHSLGADFHEWSVDEAADLYRKQIESVIGRSLTWEKDDLSLQNIQARVRAPGIWMLANTRNFLLLTTGNRSEASVGYCTMDGDTAGSLAPLTGVSKHFIRRWLVWARENLGYAELDAVIAQEPTAELRPPGQRQTDEKDLMPYDLLEAIEVAFIGSGIHPEAIPGYLATFRPEPAEELQEYTARFFSLWKRSQWKRERLAPSFHLDRFNLDPRSGGRFPIFSFG